MPALRRRSGGLPFRAKPSRGILQRRRWPGDTRLERKFPFLKAMFGTIDGIKARVKQIILRGSQYRCEELRSRHPWVSLRQVAKWDRIIADIEWYSHKRSMIDIYRDPELHHFNVDFIEQKLGCILQPL